MAVKCYYVTPITLTLIPTVRAIAVHGSATIDGRREKRHRSYPLQNARGWHPPNGRPVPGRCHRPPRPSSLPAPGTPSRSRPPTLPPSSSSRPAPSLVHPALSSGPDHRTPHPRQEFREPLLAAPPLPPDGYNDADNQRSVDAARDPLPEDDRLRAAQSASLSSPPPRAGGCVRGAEHQRPVTPGIVQPLGQVPPHGCPSSS